MIAKELNLTKGELRFTLEMCEHYLNSYTKTYRQYYNRLRSKVLRDLLKLQLKDFDRN